MSTTIFIRCSSKTSSVSKALSIKSNEYCKPLQPPPKAVNLTKPFSLFSSFANSLNFLAAFSVIVTTLVETPSFSFTA